VRPAVGLPLADHAERARGDAVPAAVADIVLDHDGADLRAEDRAGRADVEAAGVRAVLADVGAHQPAHVVLDLLLDKGDVTPRAPVQLARVVVRLARPDEAVLRQDVPFLARDLARLAADADGGVGEEADAALALTLRVGQVPVRLPHG